MSPPVRTLTIYLREAWMEILGVLRTPQFLVLSVALPILFYALFGVGMAKGRVEMSAYLFATYAVFAAIPPSMFGFGVRVAIERESRLLALKRASPMPAGAYMFGKLAAALFTSSLALAGIAGLAGYAGVTMPAWRSAAVLGLGAVSTAPLALIGLNLGLRMGSQGAVAAANVLFLSFSVLSGLWIPLSQLPDWITRIAWALPTFHLGQLSLTLAGLLPPRDVAAHVAIVLAIGAAAATGAQAGWRREAA
jgi:ABC-2 type transport system permease protein